MINQSFLPIQSHFSNPVTLFKSRHFLLSTCSSVPCLLISHTDQIRLVMIVVRNLFCLCLFPLSVSSVWTTADLTPKNYNPLRLPKVENDKPVQVKVTVIVISLLKVDEAEQVRKIILILINFSSN